MGLQVWKIVAHMFCVDKRVIVNSERFSIGAWLSQCWRASWKTLHGIDPPGSWGWHWSQVAGSCIKGSEIVSHLKLFYSNVPVDGRCSVGEGQIRECIGKAGQKLKAGENVFTHSENHHFPTHTQWLYTTTDMYSLWKTTWCTESDYLRN